jgi:hypothetical protein
VRTTTPQAAVATDQNVGSGYGVPEPFNRSTALSVNAWTGDRAPSSPASQKTLAKWATARASDGPDGRSGALAPRDINLWDWRDPAVGWGLVLPDETSLPLAARATADDAPEPIQRLLAARPGSPVLRWNRDDGNERLRRYDAGGGYTPLSLISEDGIGPTQMPRYLLIAASPQAIPWSFQYAANLRRYVGRLDLDSEGLDRYVTALLKNWEFGGLIARDPRAPVVWSVNHGHDDITWLMDQAISRKLFASYADDPDLIGRTALFDHQATGANLIEALTRTHPALVVTTSHGKTGPLHDPVSTQATLGLPVDHDHQVLDLDKLAASWRPSGAIWYSHACCAAGSDTVSQYAGLFDADSDVMQVLDGVAKACGACTAPLPRRLLGHHEVPLAAFVGHVEPTFNWSLRDPRTRQPLAHSVRKALYDGLFAQGVGRPVGWSLQRVFEDAAALLALHAQAVNGVNNGKGGAVEAALLNQVTALDRQHTVILGDPTVALLPLQARP